MTLNQNFNQSQMTKSAKTRGPSAQARLARLACGAALVFACAQVASAQDSSTSEEELCSPICNGDGDCNSTICLTDSQTILGGLSRLFGGQQTLSAALQTKAAAPEQKSKARGFAQLGLTLTKNSGRFVIAAIAPGSIAAQSKKLAVGQTVFGLVSATANGTAYKAFTGELTLEQLDAVLAPKTPADGVATLSLIVGDGHGQNLQQVNLSLFARTN